MENHWNDLPSECYAATSVFAPPIRQCDVYNTRVCWAHHLNMWELILFGHRLLVIHDIISLHHIVQLQKGSSKKRSIMNNLVRSSNVGGALSHLVEAATALAKLNGQQPQQQPVVVTNTEQTVASSAPAVMVSDEDDKSDTASSPSGGTRSKKEIFPQKLMAMLNDASLSDVIAWLPHGRSFVIIRPDVFTEQVLPKYLPPMDARGSTKYPSFTRKLNRWGFRQATRGPDTGAFHHPLFRRDNQDLCLEMVCQRSRDSTKTNNGKKSSPKNNANLPPKKRVKHSKVTIAPLTKESLDSMSAEQSTVQKIPAAASVTDDSRSVTSISNSSDSLQGSAVPIPKGITTDSDLKKAVLLRRDEEERLKVARAMLFQSYMQALRGE